MNQLPEGLVPQLPAGYQHTNLPMIQNVSCVIPQSEELGGLFIGNFMGAQNVEMLKQRGIRAVLTTSVETPIVYPGEHIPFHMRIEAHDRQSFCIGDHFEECVDFIQKCRRVTNVYVHCYAGVSRSASVVLAYIMKSHKWPYETALKFLRHKRSIVNPNEGFAVQLREFEKRLGVEHLLKLSDQSKEHTHPSGQGSSLDNIKVQQPSNGQFQFQKKISNGHPLPPKDPATNGNHNYRITGNGQNIQPPNSNTTNSVNTLNRAPPLPKIPTQVGMVRSPARQQPKHQNGGSSSRVVLKPVVQDEHEQKELRPEVPQVGAQLQAGTVNGLNGIKYVQQADRSNNSSSRPSFSTSSQTILPKRQQLNQTTQQRYYIEQKEQPQYYARPPLLSNTSERKVSLKEEPQSQKISMARKQSRGTIPKSYADSPANTSTTSLKNLNFDEPPKSPQSIRPKDLPGYRPPTVPSREPK